jgi:hypothetical protein
VKKFYYCSCNHIKNQQNNGNTGFLSMFNKYEQQIQDRIIKERQQISIIASFNAASGSGARMPRKS